MEVLGSAADAVVRSSRRMRLGTQSWRELEPPRIMLLVSSQGLAATEVVRRCSAPLSFQCACRHWKRRGLLQRRQARRRRPWDCGDRDASRHDMAAARKSAGSACGGRGRPPRDGRGQHRPHVCGPGAGHPRRDAADPWRTRAAAGAGLRGDGRIRDAGCGAG